jgi:hypothetical protein
LGDLIGGDDAGSQDPRSQAGHIHHGALDAHSTGTCINDERDSLTKTSHDMFGRRRGKLV